MAFFDSGWLIKQMGSRHILFRNTPGSKNPRAAGVGGRRGGAGEQGGATGEHETLVKLLGVQEGILEEICGQIV